LNFKPLTDSHLKEPRRAGGGRPVLNRESILDLHAKRPVLPPRLPARSGDLAADGGGGGGHPRVCRRPPHSHHRLGGRLEPRGQPHPGLPRDRARLQPHEPDPGHPRGGFPGGRGAGGRLPGLERKAQAHRALLPAGPGRPGHVGRHDRQQRQRHPHGALRLHPGLRHAPGGGPGERRADRAGHPGEQKLLGLQPDQPLHRLRGHPRHRGRSDPAAGGVSGGVFRRRGDLPLRGGGGPHGLRPQALGAQPGRPRTAGAGVHRAHEPGAAARARCGADPVHRVPRADDQPAGRGAGCRQGDLRGRGLPWGSGRASAAPSATGFSRRGTPWAR
jgi:hypothetical protein